MQKTLHDLATQPFVGAAQLPFLGLGPLLFNAMSQVNLEKIRQKLLAGETPVFQTCMTSSLRLDCSQNSIFFLHLGTSVTSVSLANLRNGGKYTFILKQGPGSSLFTMPTAKWRGGAAPTLSTAGGAYDLVAAIYSSGFASLFADYALNFA